MKIENATLYVLVKMDLQNYGFNAKDVVVSTSREALDKIMRKEYLKEYRGAGLDMDKVFDEDYISNEAYYSEGVYAYVGGYYWDIFEKKMAVTSM